MKTKPFPTYSSFLLRMWREGDSATRITLQNVSDGKQTHFTDLHHLMAFIYEEFETTSEKGDDEQ